MAFPTGATFYPGGDDSYYMPEIIQPLPHRVGEHPTNMPQNVAQMEQAVQIRDPRFSPPTNNSPRPNTSQWGAASNTYDQNPQYANNNQPTLHQSQSYAEPSLPNLLEQPNFSPFPILRNPPPNIPPTDEQKEITLESARAAVLKSTDPDTQLVWAQDTLSYVEVAQQNEQRISATQPARSRTPHVEHVLREDAMSIVSYLANQSHPKAEFMRGMWLEFGKFGHRIDKKEAYMCYSRAAEKGYARAQYRMGMQFESSNEPLKAIKYYQRGADAGDSAACYRLGMMTLLGQHGQVQDYTTALNLIYMAAQSADENAPQGAYVLGMLQAQEMTKIKLPEEFLSKDIAAGKVNVEKAAYLGFAKAQLRMGQAYELGDLSCDFDPTLSLHYYALAARQGEAEAELSISKWFLCGHEGIFDKNEELAFIYAQRAAVGGLGTAQFAMGYFYEVGIYVPVNYQTAQEWYRKSSASGNKDASARVEAISRSKTLSRRDHESIAVSKIRQQHRLSTAPVLPNLAETSPLDMPDPSRLNLNTVPTRTNPAPYPTGRPNLPSTNSVPDFRPTSAFGINPNLRAHSAATVGGPRPDGYNQYGGMPSAQQRPSSSMDGGPGGYGRGNQPPPLPPSVQGQMPQGRLSPRPGTNPPYLQPQVPQQKPLPPPTNIGYTAPPDPLGADSRRWQQYQNDHYSKPQPAIPGASGHPPRQSPRLNPQTQPSNSQQSRPSPQTQSSNSQPPKPGASSPNVRPYGTSTQGGRPPNVAPTGPPANVPVAPAPQKPIAVAPAAAKPRPDGKGPKTFEEMGVPTGKDKGECIVM